MALPGFTADRALDRSHRSYRAPSAGRPGAAVGPAFIGCDRWHQAAGTALVGAVDSLLAGDDANANLHYAEYLTLTYYGDDCEHQHAIGAGSA